MVRVWARVRVRVRVRLRGEQTVQIELRTAREAHLSRARVR